MKKILMLDNYDSFTYNLVHIFEALGVEVDVFRNDRITIEEAGKYENIVLSPGPGLPDEAGILLPLIREYACSKRILGVCLGHQAIGQVFGAELVNMKKVVHGKSKNTKVTGDDRLFKDLPASFETGRYHSWVLDEQTVQSPLIVTAVDDDGFIMAVKHEVYDVHGVQFHPESVMTPMGKQMMENWLFN
ncbi:MAG: aminodeoxychorismate/anthranilate synthase component II [Bacteroidetes bacterium]|nr:aminodeoxychorismate/anthranilate synthase component II [Bacteroidota bacterium]